MASVTSAFRHVTSASRYHPRYQSRSSMYIRGVIPRNFEELAGGQFRLLRTKVQKYVLQIIDVDSVASYES